MWIEISDLFYRILRCFDGEKILWGGENGKEISKNFSFHVKSEEVKKIELRYKIFLWDEEIRVWFLRISVIEMKIKIIKKMFFLEILNFLYLINNMIKLLKNKSI